MQCYNPVSLKSGAGNARPLIVPCGRCLACSLRHAESWALRCEHEAQLHAENSFLTLTYRDEQLELNKHGKPTLYPRDVQKFFKRLRKAISPQRMRYLYCGEYGSTTGRPHYHVLAFGYRPHDLVEYSRNASGDILYCSQSLNDLWTHGDCIVGDLTAESAAYTCRYTIKKQKDGHQYYLDSDLQPPFIRMSRGRSSAPGVPAGIGATFALAYSDLVRTGYIVDGKFSKKPIPRYYKKIFQKFHPHEYDQIVANNLHDVAQLPLNNLKAMRFNTQSRFRQDLRSL